MLASSIAAETATCHYVNCTNRGTCADENHHLCMANAIKMNGSHINFNMQGGVNYGENSNGDGKYVE